jgi:DNA-binding beta-propeller fold protein YncE
MFEVDAGWPKPLPNRWLVGSVIGVSVDSKDHVWIIHRPSTLKGNEIRSKWQAAPPVLEFDQEGNLVSSWGGPGPGYQWAQSEHTIYLDHKENVWTAGGGARDAQVLKFTREGRFLLQIGLQGKSEGSNDTVNLGGAAGLTVDAAANELYVGDGYNNHRVIVFDADTGAYKRHWGAYGKKPDDGYFKAATDRGGFSAEDTSAYNPKDPPAPQFRIVHCVRVARDGLVYVCDRTNDRIQVFRKDGTFVKEGFISKNTLGSGSAWDIAFSNDPDQKFIFLTDGTNEVVWELLRDSLEVVAGFGGAGHWAGQFYGPHNLAADSKGNLYITETYEGKRVQKFLYKGLGAGRLPSFD